MATALITGASSGIGLELAKIHASHGGNLVLVARNKKALDELGGELASKHKIKVLNIQKDLSKKDSAQEVYNQVAKKKIRIDYLINNAGFGDVSRFEDCDWETQQRMIDLNITSLTQFCKLYLPEMQNRKSGKIMNLGSVASFFPGPMMPVYFATKAFVLSFSEAINNTAKEHKVTVTTVCPGKTISGFQKVAGMKQFSDAPTSAEVAEFGYKAMLKGKSVAVHGFSNRFLVFLTRILPRDWITSMVRGRQK